MKKTQRMVTVTIMWSLRKAIRTIRFSVKYDLRFHDRNFDVKLLFELEFLLEVKLLFDDLELLFDIELLLEVELLLDVELLFDIE